MTKLLWIDMEMTGLEIEKEVIIEVAAAVTNLDLDLEESYHAIVKQPQLFIDQMDAWNQQHHKESGLIDLVPSGRSPDQVENDLLDLLQRHFQDEKVVLAGNTISQDRLFINKYFPKFAERLHYRMLDVTSWKLIFVNKLGIKFDKRNSHRAIDDILESIEELKYYISFINT